jgi:hypothetical protein
MADVQAVGAILLMFFATLLLVVGCEKLMNLQ